MINRVNQDSLTRALTEISPHEDGITVCRTAWQDEKPPAHLLMNYEVVDDASQELGDDRDPSQLRAGSVRLQRLMFAVSEPGGRFVRAIPIERDDIKQWDFRGLPEIAFSRASKSLSVTRRWSAVKERWRFAFLKHPIPRRKACAVVYGSCSTSNSKSR